MKNDFGGHDNHHYDNVDAYAAWLVESTACWWNEIFLEVQGLEVADAGLVWRKDKPTSREKHSDRCPQLSRALAKGRASEGSHNGLGVRLE